MRGSLSINHQLDFFADYRLWSHVEAIQPDYLEVSLRRLAEISDGFCDSFTLCINIQLGAVYRVSPFFFVRNKFGRVV
jgi:hypothetical protein